ncbi:MAG TPA: GlsB/YeaQ/YmgE family stress response membrane protein [Hyphomicrobiaceae bacterium]|nr:GlsB/YeaQ/YmgE family stress response membrane protein [Hyphomicrobiaceae bacterium]
MPSLEQIQPYTPIIVMVVNGLIAGWLAGLLLGGGGLIRNVFVGIIGAFVGGALVRYELLALPAGLTNVTNAIPYGTQILISTIGAIIVVVLARFLGGR